MNIGWKGVFPAVDVPGLGPLTIDVAYDGNYHAIVEPQSAYVRLDAMGAASLIGVSRPVREVMRGVYEPVDPTIRGVNHVLWADMPRGDGADGRNAVFYGDRAIHRGPCGTGHVGTTGASGLHRSAGGRRPVRPRKLYRQPLHRTARGGDGVARSGGTYSVDRRIGDRDRFQHQLDRSRRCFLGGVRSTKTIGPSIC